MVSSGSGHGRHYLDTVHSKPALEGIRGFWLCDFYVLQVPHGLCAFELATGILTFRVKPPQLEENIGGRGATE